MTEVVEREESKKTVVAFITGLLIGGLLVWIFSSTPGTNDRAQVGEDDEVTLDRNAATNTNNRANVINATDRDTDDSSFEVEDQDAGGSVMIGDVDFPTERGWVVVRDFMDGTPGRILGAARYDTKAGLIPTEVELVRDTEAGSSYQVVFYTDAGALGFNTKEDMLIEGHATTFKAN